MEKTVFFSYSNEDISKNSHLVELKKKIQRKLEYYSIPYFDYKKHYFGLRQVGDHIRNSDLFVVIIGNRTNDIALIEQNIAGEIRQINSIKQSNPHTKIITITTTKMLGLVRDYGGSYPELVNIMTLTNLMIEIEYYDIRNIWNYLSEYAQNQVYKLDAPYYFSYDKDILALFKKLYSQKPNSEISTNIFLPHEKCFLNDTQIKSWPTVKKIKIANKLLSNPISTKYKYLNKNTVYAGVLSEYFPEEADNKIDCEKYCLRKNNLSFPEAGFRQEIYDIYQLPENRNPNNRPKIGIVVSGGIAPGINSVIHSIVERHWNYYKMLRPNFEERSYEYLKMGKLYNYTVQGFKFGFKGLTEYLRTEDYNERAKYYENLYCNKEVSLIESHFLSEYQISAKITNKHIDEPGSILSTTRMPELLENEDVNALVRDIVEGLKNSNIKILYVLGGEGSMKLSHQLALYSLRNKCGVSIVGIPKTMDNDILWVWKPFGFESAVAKACEIINQISWEIKSNPKLAIVQLFGSFSGFVACHAVLGSHAQNCDLVIIPEIAFRIERILVLLKERLEKHKQTLLVISECSFPLDANEYLENDKYGLAEDEKKILREVAEKYYKTERLIDIYGPTKDYYEWNKALLKLLTNVIVTEVVNKLGWKSGKPIILEPKHLVRSIPPSPMDVIHASRLGFLAVDSAMAGCTDFMISQWLTEYCLVPLSLVTMGSKQVPTEGTFWNSVLDKTGQPKDLVSISDK